MVAEQVQQVIGRPVIIDPRVRAQVTVLSNAPMSPDAFYRLFLSALEVHGFVALDSGNAIQIVPDANARFGAGDDYVTQAIVLDNIGAAQLVPILRPLLPQSAHLAAHQPSNALIVADRPQNMRRMLDLIRRMDQAGTQEVEVIGLENAAADDVVRMLGQLNQAAQAAGGAPPIQVISDARTNSVLLAGSGTIRLQMRALIAHLDTPSAAGGDTLVRYLNYADAEDLATKLQAQFGGGGGGAAAPAEGGGAPAVSGPVTIWADPGTNALIINAPERIREDMLAIVNQIDIPRLQVQVDAIIVELSEEKTAQLGVTWLSAGDDLFGLTNFSSAGGGGILGLAGSAAGDTPNLAAIAEGIYDRCRQDQRHQQLGGAAERPARRRRDQHHCDAANRDAGQRGSRDSRRARGSVRHRSVHEYRREPRLREPLPNDPARRGRYEPQDYAADQRG